MKVNCVAFIHLRATIFDMKFIKYTLSLLLIAQFTFAQRAIIKGFLYDKGNGEPIIFTNVTCKGTTYGAQTDVNGYFSITKLPLGEYSVMAAALGYDTSIVKVNITTADEITSIKLFITKKTTKLREIEISADRQEMKTETRIGLTKISPKDIKKIPTIGGEADIAQFLQVLPGVNFTGDQGGQLYIRGGSPVMNKVLLDGMTIYNPFHSIGLFSVFDADILRNTDVSTGGFDARYGGRVSSVMDITTRDGNKKRLSGKVATSTFGAKLLLEGPLTKVNEDGANSSFIISAKNSYLSQTAKTFYKYADPDRLNFDFLDLYGKVSFNSNNGSKINAFTFLNMDSVLNPQLQKFKWSAFGGGLNFVIVPNASKAMIKTNLNYSDYTIKMKEAGQNDKSSTINAFSFSTDFIYFFDKNEMNYGFEFTNTGTKYYFVNDYSQKSDFNGSSTEPSFYFRYKFNLGKLIIDPSMRMHFYVNNSWSFASPEPRLSAKYVITDRIRIKAAGGLYSQNLISATNNRDIVNLFYGYISSPESSTLPASLTTESGTTYSINNGLQRAYHIISGIEIDLFKHFYLNVEGYNKNFFQLLNVNPKKQFEDNATNENIPDSLKKDFIAENGYARGIDFSLKYDYKRFYVWAVYSLGYVTRWNGNRRYQPVFDRRHNVNFVIAYTFGKRLDWEFNLRFNLASGFPVTRTQSIIPNNDFTAGTNTNITDPGALQPKILYGPDNGGRLPYYNRLDIGLKKKFVITENSIIEANLGCTNVYDRKNIFYANRLTNKFEYQLPVMPTIGMSWNF